MDVLNRYFIFALSIYFMSESLNKLYKGAIEGRKITLLYALSAAVLIISAYLAAASYF